MLIAWNFFDSLAEGLTGLVLMLDGLVYWLISLLFGMFEELAKFEFLTQDTYQEIVNRFLVVLGVVMLFYLAYALLKALVNPDELKSSGKIVTNLVISLILLNVVPVIFNYSYELQNIIIDENVVGKVVLGNGNDNIASVGKSTAMTFLEAFLRPSENAKIEGYDNWEHLKACILDNQSEDYECQGNEGFRHITLTANSITSGDTEYMFIISTICGAFLVYVIASFCLDLGIRVIKLAFYQIISPIPIMMRIIPEKKSVFDNWVKATLATYLEVFIRLFVMYLIAFLFTIIPDIMSGFNNGKGDLSIFGTIIVLMGLFAFAKQAPKLIGDVMGLDAGNLKLGIKDKLATGGAFTAGAAIGGGATAMVRNLTHGVGNVRNAEGFRSRARAVFGAAGSTLTGAVSGAARSGYGARNAQNVGDMRNAASAGATAVTTNRDNREAYRASHGGTTRGVVTGHVSDVLDTAKEWAGVGISTSLSPTEQREYDVLNGMKDRVGSIEKLWKNEKQWIDADAANRYAKAELQAYSNREEIFKKLNEEVKNLRKNDKTLSMDDAVTRAMNSIYSSASAQDQSILNSGINDYIDLARKSDNAQNFLDATTQTIKEDKKPAIDSMTAQLNEFRRVNSEYADKIGVVGDAYDSTKSAYTKRLNELNEVKARAKIESEKKNNK